MILRFSFVFLFVLSVWHFLPKQVFAEQPSPSPENWETIARAVDAATLIADKTTIHLWGVENIQGMDAPFALSARSMLDNAIGPHTVHCALKSKLENATTAQCTNDKDFDLGLLMLQQGFVVVDRSSVYGTVFEEPYIQAETQAKNEKLGVWSELHNESTSQGQDGNWMLILSFVFFLCIIIILSVLSLVMLHGFQKVVEAQKDNMNMMERERALKDKERELFAMMLDSEIKANKSNIQAYMAVYNEMLNALKTDRSPKYQKSGDILQTQPALERAVFDHNTDKMDVLGDRLSSAVIHFYARIKTHPEYVTLEPDMPLDSVVAMVEKALKNAITLDKTAESLISSFSQNGHASKAS